MGFYANTIVPRPVTCACGTKPILKQREKVVPEARGQVLEIGMGAGHNLPYYQRDQVERVVGSIPVRRVEARAASSEKLGYR